MLSQRILADLSPEQAFSLFNMTAASNRAQAIPQLRTSTPQ